jgi:hypothetical protein
VISCQAKVGSIPFMEFRNIEKKVSPLLRVTGCKNVNTYSIAIQCISHDIGRPKIYNNSIYVCVCACI